LADTAAGNKQRAYFGHFKRGEDDEKEGERY
jgi:hypothetical protein